MKILIVKTSSLGDIVHAFPALSLLREKFPDAKICWAVEKPFASLVEAHPFVDQVIEIDTKKWRQKFFSFSTWKEISKMYQRLRGESFDLLFDLQGNTKSAFVTLFAKAKIKIGYGFKTVWEYPNLLATQIRFDPPRMVNVREENLFLVKSYLKIENFEEKFMTLKIFLEEKKSLNEILGNPLLQNRRKILVSPGSHWKNKQINEETLFELLKEFEMHEDSTFLFIWGNAFEHEQAQNLVKKLNHAILLEKLSLPLLQNLMKEMDLVIAMDSLPLHLAASTGVATYGIFGPSLAKKFAPTETIHKNFQGKCPYGRVFERRCPILRSCPTGDCLKQIDGKTLYAKFNSSKDV